jgi:hypothetical protein
MSPHQRLRDWVNNDFARSEDDELKPGSGIAGAARRGAINWITTLLSSLPASKLSKRKIRLCYHSVRRHPMVWCFLDASRSTGMNRFLSIARDSLIDLAVRFRSRRWDLLLLQDNQIKWITNKGSFHSFSNALTQVNHACGKSYIFESIHHLHRAILRQGYTSRDRLIIVSDGLASPEPGQGHRHTPSGLRYYLRRITRMGVSMAWLYPSHELALARWLQKILDGLPIMSIKL